MVRTTYYNYPEVPKIFTPFTRILLTSAPDTCAFAAT
jgi:hypothetical protein